MSTELPVDILAFVAEVEARANDAQSGPWWVVLLPANADEFDQDAVIMSEHISITDKHEHGEVMPHNAHFIAHARSDVPKLCAIVREQAARVDDLESSCKLAIAEMMNVVRGVAKELDPNLCDPQGNEDVWIPVRRMRERIAKLEALGPWIETNRLAELDRAKTWAGRPIDEDYVLGRADAFEQVGYELNNRAGKDLRKETPQ